MSAPLHRVVGLMSGTSLDGIDAAFVETDGEQRVSTGPSLTLPYDDALRARLRAALGGKGAVAEVERALTEVHGEVVRALIAQHSIAGVDLVGFHGHTILHRPDQGRTWQLGDGALLAGLTGIDVVCDFRSADVAAGGEGAPFAPLYHAALASGIEKPVAVLNIGGVANVTWIGPGAGDILAFDTGPGNALIDDWALAHSGRPVDGAATLTAMTAAAAARAAAHFPLPARRWLVCGGGRRNPVLMAALASLVGKPIDPVEAVGWDGDALEAQAFAYLAVRSTLGLPLSLPGTTGVARPMTGGRLFFAPTDQSLPRRPSRA